MVWSLGAGAAISILVDQAIEHRNVSAAVGLELERASAAKVSSVTSAAMSRSATPSQSPTDATTSSRTPWVANANNAAEQLTSDVNLFAAQAQVQVLQMMLSSEPWVQGSSVRHLEARIDLSGTYANVKRLLAELLVRRPDERALKRLMLRRAAGTDTLHPTVEATVVVALAQRVELAPLPEQP